jgi:hypothetical protein
MRRGGRWARRAAGGGGLGRPPLGSLGLIIAWATALELSGPHHGVVLALLPLLVLLASLAAGRYLGERGLAQLRARLEGAPPRRRPVPSAPPSTSRSRSRPRGGALIASSLAGRSPPRFAG